MCPCDFPETPDIETSSDDYAERFSGEIGSWFVRLQEAATLRMLAPFPGASVLDVGGGHGQIAHALVANGYQVTVLGSAEICKGRIQNLLDEKRCSFHVGNLLHLPYPDRRFDIVISYRLVSHVAHWKTFLAELSRVAKRVVLLDYPSVRSINSVAPLLFGFKKFLEGNTRPYTSFRESQLLEMFEAAGFVRTARYAQFFLPMVLHRTCDLSPLSRATEGIFRFVGFTSLFGSPVILKLERVRG